ncbi:MAG: type II toxin-antitoxin system mRNA interferase toxin, RelE/StbE family [bacterium]|nr:type II toxin-antitoxin system mRNA interferase toxin, RelE/StbE family [bacterium]
MIILFKPTFVRQYKSLESQLQEEVVEKIGLFKNPKNHKRLKVHKLSGHLSDRYSFSVNYKIRIVFSYLSKKEAILLALGDHDIYK